MSFTVGSDALLGSLTSDPELDALFSVEADIRAMMRFELALAKAHALSGVISKTAADAICAAAEVFSPDHNLLEEGFRKDGVAAPSMVRQFKATLAKEVADSFHVGATSQDLADTSLMIRLSEAAKVIEARMAITRQTLSGLDRNGSENMALKSRTRMQVALPINVHHKLAGWQAMLAEAQTARPVNFPLQLGGPDGTASGFGGHYSEIAGTMADELGLAIPPHHWQTNRKPLLDVANWIGGISNGLGKIAQDILIMSQSEIGEVKLSGSGGSSSMAHKQNPVAAEFVVAQARFCQVQLSGLNIAAIHENERSGTAMALEWMLLPQLVLCCGNMLIRANDLLDSLVFAGDDG